MAACLLSLLICFSACSRKEEPRPAPRGPSATVADARAWFNKQPHPAAKGSPVARGDSSRQPVIALDWTQALVDGTKLVAPFADTLHTFRSGKYGYRFLVVSVAPDSTYRGRIVELVTADKPATPQQAAQLALDGTQEVLDGQQPGPVAGFTGALILYSPSYGYETGLAYQDGGLQPLKMMAGPAGPDTCYNYYLVGYNNVGDEVVHEFLFSSCTGGIPPVTIGWGGGGAGTTGGGGGGGPSNQPKMPCAALTRDGQNAQVQAQLNQLKAQVTDNKEYGVAMYYDAAGNPVFSPLVGLPGQEGIDISGINGTISSLTHTHYTGLLSIFSPKDLQAMWTLFQTGHMTNPSTFTMTVITASGTIYSLGISNTSAFSNFGDNALGDVNSFSNFETLYGNFYHILTTNTVAQNELAFLQMLTQNNTGLTLYKGDLNNLASWKKLSYSNGIQNSSACN